MSPAIEAQLQSFETRAAEREQHSIALKKQIRHQEAAVATSIEALIAAWIAQFQNVCDLSNSVASSTESIRAIWAPKVIAHFRKLFDDAKGIQPEVRRIVEQGYQIAGLREFNVAAQEAEIMATHSDRWLNGLSELNQGQGIPLSEAMNELRRRSGAHRA